MRFEVGSPSLHGGLLKKLRDCASRCKVLQVKMGEISLLLLGANIDG